MRTVSQMSDKMTYFRTMHRYTVTFINRTNDPKKLIKYKVKRDLYVRGYLLLHDMLWGKNYRKKCNWIHIG